MHTSRDRSTGHRTSATSHVTLMSSVGLVILVVLLTLGKPMGEALLLAILLSCPAMMIVMPFMHSKNMNAAATSPEEAGKS